MNILFYYPSNQRTVSIESVVNAFKAQGHTVTLLTQSPEGELHEELKKNGVSTYTHIIEKGNAWLYYLKHILFLKRFVRAHHIDIVYSHLQQANIISVFAQLFSRAKFYICRHHADRSGLEKNANQDLFDRVINRLSRLMIVPSGKVYEQVVTAEGVDPARVKLIYYGYDFSKYPKPDPAEVEKIRDQYASPLLLVKIARLVPGKRYDILFDAVRDLVHEGLDIRLLAISEGPLMETFRTYIAENNLQNHIFLLGNRSNVIDYLAAADAVPLLSESEASNSVIKEAGLVKKCVLVCKGVGDFDDYIRHGISGLQLDKRDPGPALKMHLHDLYHHRIDKTALGENLSLSVHGMFSIDKVIGSYDLLNSKNH